MLLFISFSSAVNASESAQNIVKVTLLDGTKSQLSPLANQAATIMTVAADGSLTWWASKQADDAGVVEIDNLDQLQGAGLVLVVPSPINGQDKRSNLIENAGVYQFVVGNLPVTATLIDDVSGEPIKGQKVDAFRLTTNGERQWYAEGITDDNGQMLFDLDNIATGARYVFSAKVYNDFTHYSADVSSPGEVTMRFGTVRVALIDHGSEQALANTAVTVYQLNAHRQRDYFADVVSDADGVLKLDLAGIDKGVEYQLSATVFNGFDSFSPLLNSAGDHDFRIGATALQLIDGSRSNGAILAQHQVDFYRVESGIETYVTSVASDPQGLIRVDFPASTSNLIFNSDSKQVFKTQNQTLSYVVKSRSHVDDRAVFQSAIALNSDNQLVVGHPPVRVHLTDVLTGNSYDNQLVTAYQLDINGNQRWYSSQTTDENGVAVFDVAGMNDGQQYQFSVNVFASGSSWSQIVSDYGEVDFKIGAVPVTLLDKDSEAAIAGKTVAVYQQLGNGQLHWVKDGLTDANGRLTFDLEALNPDSNDYANIDQKFVFKVHSPFNQGKNYYGPVISAIGKVLFYVKQGQYGELDKQAPNISLEAPYTIVANANGFVASGSFSDNVGVGVVELTVVDPVLGENTLLAQSDDLTGKWQGTVPKAWLSAGHSVVVSATAIDFALNRSIASRQFIITEDIAAPSIIVNSHFANDSVNVNGFTLRGEAFDDIAVANIKGSLFDEVLGQTVTDELLNFDAKTGQWAFALSNNLISADSQVVVNLVVTDVNGKTAELNLPLRGIVIATDPLLLADRITFGITPQLLAEVKAGSDILAQQLNPDDIYDGDFEAQMALMAQNQVTTTAQLQDYLLTYMIGSKKQLREVMAWFWENHFNTNINSHRQVSFELAENQLFRQHALGNFRTLLEISAKSPAMIHYLNNQQNFAGRANENYAREIMELHTMGVDGGYDADDIAELARIFTGWHEANGQFAFNDELHDNGDKVFLGHRIYGGGVTEGEQVLDILSLHPSTANFICAKLVALFVSDSPINALQSQCATQFLASNGDISAVLQVVLGSEYLADSDNYRSKVKTPLELVTATARAYAQDVNPRLLNQQLAAMGMSLFEYPLPTGFSEFGADWLNTQALLQRVALVNQAAWRLTAPYDIDVFALVQQQGLSHSEDIITWLFELALGNQFSPLEYQIARDILNQSSDFDLNHMDAEQKLQRLFATVLSYPAYQMQ